MRLTALMTLLLACACPNRPATGPGTGAQPIGAGSGSAAPIVAAASGCDGVKGRVEQLYRTEAQHKEPKRVEEAVADNTAMAMSDCARQPQVTVPCITKVTTVAELEKQCLIPIDDEGTEGER